MRSYEKVTRKYPKKEEIAGLFTTAKKMEDTNARARGWECYDFGLACSYIIWILYSPESICCNGPKFILTLAVSLRIDL